MLRLASPSRTATMSLAALASALAEEPRLTERAYVVLEKQDLGERHRRTDVTARTLCGDVTLRSAFFCPRSVTLCSVLAVLLLLMVVMAVCVYKPLNRRWKPSRAEKPEPSARFPVTLEAGGRGPSRVPWPGRANGSSGGAASSAGCITLSHPPLGCHLLWWWWRNFIKDIFCWCLRLNMHCFVLFCICFERTMCYTVRDAIKWSWIGYAFARFW